MRAQLNPWRYAVRRTDGLAEQYLESLGAATDDEAAEMASRTGRVRRPIREAVVVPSIADSGRVVAESKHHERGRASSS